MTSPELRTESVVDRNFQILESLKDGRVPLLSFEQSALEERLAYLEARQTNLAEQLQQAMTQSSETYHDNAPADAVVNDAIPVAIEAEKIIATLKQGVQIEQPVIDYPNVTLGSVVAVTFGNLTAPDLLYLTGISRSVPADILGEDIAAATLTSPLGRSILGLTKGESATYFVNDREMKVTIIDIMQINGASS